MCFVEIEKKTNKRWIVVSDFDAKCLLMTRDVMSDIFIVNC